MNKIKKAEEKFMNEIKEIVKDEFLLMAKRKGWQKSKEVNEDGGTD